MRVSLLCAGLVALAACDIPAAVFDGGNQTTTSAGGSSSTSQAGSSGGDTTTTTTPMHTTTTTDSGGGGVGGAGGDTTTSSGGTGGAPFMGPIVPCGSPSVTCDPYQVCCYHVFDFMLDHCATADTCDLNLYGALKCNGPEDCPGGVCCLKTSEAFGFTFKDSECAGSCPADQELMCNPANPVCVQGQSCVAMLANYQGYNVCQ